MKKKRYWVILLLPLTAVALYVANRHPAVVENVYSRRIYPVLTGLFGRLFALFPFSIAEFLLAGTVVFCIWRIVALVRRLRSEKGRRKEIALSFAANVLCGVSVTYFLFGALCGLNYQRLSFTQQCGLDVHPSSAQELAELCGYLVEAANDARLLVNQDENGVMKLSQSSVYALAKDAQTVYPNAGSLYPQLSGYVGRPKPVLLSPGMSWLDLGGVYFPFTCEPNVNVDMPDYNIPSTMMHEMSHFKGFMREDEANFLAYVTCRESGNADFVYSGTVLALIHSTNALYDADKDLYWQVMGPLSQEVRTDLAYNSAYWKQFEGPAAQVSSAVNDTYLRINNQSSGVKSYGMMVDLLLAEWRGMQA